MYLFIYVKTDRRVFLYYYFGVNVLSWCHIFHLFDTLFQNSRYGHARNL